MKIAKNKRIENMEKAWNRVILSIISILSHTEEKAELLLVLSSCKLCFVSK